MDLVRIKQELDEVSPVLSLTGKTQSLGAWEYDDFALQFVTP